MITKTDFIGFIEVRNSNPNGDPDRNNMPRQNEDGYGYMTDVCLKRKIKDCVYADQEGQPGFDLFIQKDDVALETKMMAPIAEFGADKFNELSTDQKRKLVVDSVCSTYFDVRCFGGVMTSYAKDKDKYFDGQINGPVQITMAQSLEPISPEELTISRLSVTTEKDKLLKNNELGKKWIVPYGVYRFEGHISADLAEKTGFSEEDLEVLLNGIFNMYENNHSAAAPEISVTNLFVFKHENKRGNCRFNVLRDCIHVEKKVNGLGMETYVITLNKDAVPDGVQSIVY